MSGAIKTQTKQFCLLMSFTAGTDLNMMFLLTPDEVQARRLKKLDEKYIFKAFLV